MRPNATPFNQGEDLKMTAYVIANVNVSDPDRFAEYGKQVVDVVHQFGGRYLVRGGEIDNLEGDAGLHRRVVLEFPDKDAARAFYDSEEYAPLLDLRLASATSTLSLVDGYDDQP